MKKTRKKRIEIFRRKHGVVKVSKNFLLLDIATRGLASEYKTIVYFKFLNFSNSFAGLFFKMV